MKRNLVGGLAVTGALLLWTSVASFAQGPTAESLAGAASDKVAKCLSEYGKALDAIKTTVTPDNAEATAKAKDVIADAKDKATDIAENATGRIADVLEEYLEQTDEDDTPPSLTDFGTAVDAIATKACDRLTALATATETEVAGILANTTVENENEDEMENETESGHHNDANKAAETEHHNDANKAAEVEIEK